MVSAPQIAGGLIGEKADIYAAIEAGAISSHPRIRTPGLSERRLLDVRHEKKAGPGIEGADGGKAH